MRSFGNGFSFADIMNNTLAKRIEIVTNLSIIVVALIGGAVLVKNYLLPHSQPSTSEVKQGPPVNPQPLRSNSATRSGPAEGTQLTVAGFDWGVSRQTVLLALSDKCHFCSESAPFYKRLAADLAQLKDVRLVAVFPQGVGEAKKYLDELGVPIEQVAQAQLGTLGVNGTPTLLIVDKAGVVKQSWVGRLSAEKESEVLSRVKV